MYISVSVVELITRLAVKRISIYLSHLKLKNLGISNSDSICDPIKVYVSNKYDNTGENELARLEMESHHLMCSKHR